MSTVTLTATYQDGAGTPCSGRVVFRLAEVNTSGSIIYTDHPVSKVLDASGALSVALQPTDTMSTTSSYEVREKLNGSEERVYYVQIPSTPATQNLAALRAYATAPVPASAPAVHGALNGLSIDDHAQYELAAAASAPSSRSFYTSTALRHVAPAAGAENRYTVIAASLGWEGSIVQEPSVWYYGGAYHMIYSGGSSSRLGYATAPSPLGPWSKNATAVIGGGAGGYAGNAYHANVLVDGTTLYCYFVDSASPTLLRVATANIATPTSWSMTGTTYALQGGATLWGNTFVYKEANGTYTMMFEQSIPGSSWQSGFSTLGSSPTGAQASVSFPNTSLRLASGTVTGTASTGWFTKDADGNYVLFYHGGKTGSIPTDIYRATSTDKATWTLDNNSLPILRRQASFEQDQVADPYLIQSTEGVWYMFYEGYDNALAKSTIAAVPLVPQHMLKDGSTWRRYDVPDPNPSVDNPQRPRVTKLTSDFTTTSTSYVDLLQQYNFFTPRGSVVKITVDGVISNTTTADTVMEVYSAYPGGSHIALGTFRHPSGGNQFPFCRSVVVTGLTPGQAYLWTVAVKVSAGTFQCRPAAFPAYEGLTMTIEDANYA